MASVKEQLSAHCDKLAFGIVAVIVIAVVAVTMTGEDPIRAGQAEIARLEDEIARKKEQQQSLEPVEPKKVAEELKQRWTRSSITKDAFAPFAMHAQPGVLRIVTKAAANKSMHNPGPMITGLTIARDPEAKRPLTTLVFKFGKLQEVTDVSADVERRVAGTTAWKPIAKVPYVEGTDSYTVVDKSELAAGVSYLYRVKSHAKGLKDWAEGSAADKDGVQPCVPPEAEAAAYKIPYDMRIMFFQGRPSDVNNEVGTAFFKVGVYDYATGKEVTINTESISEMISQSRKPAAKDLLPRTRYYLNVIKPPEPSKGGLVAILKNIDDRKELQLPLGKWVPESIECPAAWAAAAPAEEAKEAPAEEAKEAPAEESKEAPAAEPAGTDEGAGKAAAPPAEDDGSAAPPDEPKEDAGKGTEEGKSSETEETTGKESTGGRFK